MIRLAVDPGGAYLGLVITDGDALPLRLLHRETVEVGRVVELAKPRTKTRRDGTTWTQTCHRVITGEDVARVAQCCVELARTYGAERVLTEHVNDVFLQAFPERSHTSRATAVNRATWIEGEIRGELRASGFEVAEGIRMASARARVRRAKGATALGIPEAVKVGIGGWGSGSTEHERDAAVLCLYDVLPEAAARTRPAARALRAQLPREPRGPRGPAAPTAPSPPCKHCGHQGRGRHRLGCPTARLNLLRRMREAEAPKMRAPLVVIPVPRPLRLPVPYVPATGYEDGAVVDHPRFGRGVVRVIDRTKIEVRFADVVRMLVHAGTDRRGEVAAGAGVGEAPF